MNDSVINFNDVSKKFCAKLQKQMLYGMSDIAKNIFNIAGIASNKLRKDEFWAIRNLSFDVKKGEAVGLVGVNGSGKSTILKLINGIFMPDKGEITICGSVGALIEAGAGFHPYLSGRENIYLNGAILGMKKKDIELRFNDIVAFSEIGEFLDMPVKNYSSGMNIRLGFSVAAYLTTDILLIDEILAVGDLEFQKKCIKKILNLKGKGTTIIMVSHNLDHIKQICDRCILLKERRIKNIDKTEKVLKIYEGKK